MGLDEVVAPLGIILQSLMFFIVMLELRPPRSSTFTICCMVVMQHYDGPGIDTVLRLDFDWMPLNYR